MIINGKTKTETESRNYKSCAVNLFYLLIT